MESHQSWSKDIEETQGHAVTYPMIGDTDLAVSKLYNMLPADESGTSEGRTAATNATVRSVVIIGPDKKIKLMLTYPMTTGRNFNEILRVLDSMQLTVKHKVATPANLFLLPFDTTSSRSSFSFLERHRCVTEKSRHRMPFHDPCY